ncbi:hypothetical protein GT037_007439 [Alternaria burnsii]|uniref:Uncharacterized protein n=1 Tax=Alternaria burnsii TaxID=1187904 RepID=A0A8H7B000_9PLEO|nr:uncharacterized protein GT037_007439 [Alternaria burnsii]KAF7674679.1 hypothetical protein GT037_007439 [Alternaria burnsii]
MASTLSLSRMSSGLFLLGASEQGIALFLLLHFAHPFDTTFNDTNLRPTPTTLYSPPAFAHPPNFSSPSPSLNATSPKPSLLRPSHICSLPWIDPLLNTGTLRVKRRSLAERKAARTEKATGRLGKLCSQPRRNRACMALRWDPAGFAAQL